MFKPFYTIISLGVCYLTYIWFINPIFSVGEIVNFSVTICLCILMYLIRYKHLRIEISQANQMREVQQELTDAQRDFRLTIEQYEMIREQESSITFEWDIQEDWIRFSKEWKHYFDHPESILNFMILSKIWNSCPHHIKRSCLPVCGISKRVSLIKSMSLCCLSKTAETDGLKSA